MTDEQAERLDDELIELLALVADSFDARDHANNGRFCECDEPDVCAPSFMCRRCRLINRDRERAEVLAIVSAHDFVPNHRMRGGLADAFCAVCMNGPDHERHHGIPAEGRTRWGEAVAGAAP